MLVSDKTAITWVDDNYRYLSDINDRIWEFAEVGLQEYRSAELLASELEKAGFSIQRGVAGMPTAFVACWGSERPKVGFLAEYDALPHLSQKAVPFRDPVRYDAPGHGCGHNTYGTAVLGAVLGLKHEMEQDRLGGTIVFYGCPAEETLVGKVFMAREGLFDDLDCALTWHPSSLNVVSLGTSNAMNSAKFTFFGRAAHAGGSPDQGRSALDAVELMNVGVNYLREHVLQDARLHYVITKGGGEPNVVPPEAQVWYYVRAPRREDVDAIYERVRKIAQGAALMTETTFKEEILVACYNMLSNRTLSDIMHQALVRLGAPEWSEEELGFARKLAESFSPGQKEASIRNSGAPVELLDQALHTGIAEPFDKDKVGHGSTDVSDVSWVTPTAQFGTACEAIGAAGHSWQTVATSGMSIAHKGMALAAKVMAITGGEALRDPELLKRARAEFEKALGGNKYKCAVPPEAKPPLDQLPRQG